MSDQLPERKRILEYLELLEQHGGSPDSSGEITVLRAYASGRLVPAEPNYEAATNELKEWSTTNVPEEMAKAIVDAALGEPA